MCVEGGESYIYYVPENENRHSSPNISCISKNIAKTKSTELGAHQRLKIFPELIKGYVDYLGISIVKCW